MLVIHHFFPCMKKIQHRFLEAARITQCVRDHSFFEIRSTLIFDVETMSTSAEFPIQLWIICAPSRRNVAWQCTERADICPARGQTVTRGANLSSDSSLFPSCEASVAVFFSTNDHKHPIAAPSLPRLWRRESVPSIDLRFARVELLRRAERWTQSGGESKAGSSTQ